MDRIKGEAGIRILFWVMSFNKRAMRNILIILFSLAIHVGYSQGYKNMTVPEKVSDFTYLYETLRGNYPYFNVYNRTHGECWLSKKEAFLEKVRSTSDDREYILLIDSVLGILQDKGLDLAPTRRWEKFRTAYGEACLTNAGYIPWVNILNESEDEALYWSSLLKETDVKPLVSGRKVQLSDSLLSEHKIGILKIPSFESDHMEDDFDKINEFLYSVYDYEYLIIDIQGNRGGSSAYWMNGIVSRLISMPIDFGRYLAIRRTRNNYLFFSRYLKKEAFQQVNLSFSSLPYEFSGQDFNFVEETTTIYPFLPIPFAGKIIVLTDKAVYSAADEFAYFAKHSSWAMVAGEVTSGGGIGSDPALIRLPISGILVRYPALVGLNRDGSLNMEKKTAPDMMIDGEDAEERLSNLIKYLTRKGEVLNL